MKKTLFIIAAGKAKRMGNIDCPKAMFPINGVPVLQHNLRVLKPLFDDIIVVVQKGMEHAFNVEATLLPIESGKGNGHAVLEAIRDFTQDEVYLMWGDVIINDARIAQELIETPINHDELMIYPVQAVKNPYCETKILTGMVSDEYYRVKGINLDRTSEYGFSDLCLFKCNTEKLQFTLSKRHDTMIQTNSYGSTELGFLFIVEDDTSIVYQTAYENSVLSFNTVEEAKEAEKKCQHFS